MEADAEYTSVSGISVIRKGRITFILINQYVQYI